MAVRGDIININTIVDKINMKDLPVIITAYLHDNSIKEFNNLRAFYARLLEYINEEVKVSYLNRILKYLSTDVYSVINIIEDFNDGVYDNELMLFSKYLVDKINSTRDYSKLYEHINRQINFIFFDNSEEYCRAKTYHNDKKYDEFIFNLLKHTFKNYQINMPGIVAKRLLTEAMTLKFNSEHRNRMIQASAELGNDLAINLHASHVYLKDKDASTRILLTGKITEVSLWEIAFQLENNFVSKDTVQLVKNKLGDILENDDFLDKISVTSYGKSIRYDMNLLYAFKIYYYVANKFNFTKAYNSLGKLMIFDFVIYDNNRDKTIKIAKNYLKKAIQMGNINSATNLSVYYYNNQNDMEYNRETTKKLFGVSSILGDIISNYYYGKILIDEGNFEEGVVYLKYAADSNNGPACFELGKYYELKGKIDLAVDNYKQAILNGYYDAAYYMALLYINMNSVIKNECFTYEMSANYLISYKDKFSEQIKIKAEKLLDSIM